ncbi:MAG: hypothetical protein ABIR48_01330 [Gammaproteobacteria bacterium]
MAGKTWKSRPGQTLHIQAPGAFRLVWSCDEWLKVNDVAAKASGLGIYFVDIPLPKTQRAPVRFTFFWLEVVDIPFFRRECEQWEGRDYAVVTS